MARSDQKRHESNVAIELGYALKALGDGKLLMVAQYLLWRSKFLPFDLAHKAVDHYELARTPTEAVAAEGTKLRGKLVVAFRRPSSYARRSWTDPTNRAPNEARST